MESAGDRVGWSGLRPLYPWESSSQLPYIPLKATHSKTSSSPCPSQAEEQAAAHVAGHQRCSDLQGTSGVEGQGSVFIWINLESGLWASVSGMEAEKAEPELINVRSEGGKETGEQWGGWTEQTHTRHLLYVEHCAGHFICTNTLNLQKYLEGWY